MARNGSGTYVLATGNPVTNGQTITDSLWNDTFNDVATALTDSISKDGQTTPTANMPMGGYKHTNVANSASRTDYAKVSQTQDSAYTYLTSVSGADTITASAGMSMTAYAAGQMFHFVSAGANTGAVTLNINSIGAKDVTKNGTTALIAGDIPSGATVIVIYDGTRFQVQSTSKTFQPLDATLTALASSLTAAGKIPYATATDTLGELDFVDEDDMASNSATGVPSQQSVKAYADNLIASASAETPVASEDYFIFEDATDSTQKKALISTISTSPFTDKYESSATAITLGGLHTFAHSLGAVPFGVVVMLENVTSDGGYSTGDRIYIDTGFQNQSGGGGQAVYADSTNVYVRVSTAVYQAHRKDTGAPFNLTTASWKIVIKAFV